MKITIIAFIIVLISATQAMVELETTKSGRNYIVVGRDQSHLSTSPKRSVYLEDSDHHVSLGYDSELIDEVFVFDSHEDKIIDLECAVDSLVVTAADPSIFDSWKEETVLIGGLQWDCDDSNGELAPIYRSVVQMKRLSENKMYVETEETSFLAAFKKLDLEYDFRPVPEEEREELKKRSVILDSPKKRTTFNGNANVQVSTSASTSTTIGSPSRGAYTTVNAGYNIVGGCYAKLQINVRWWRLRVNLNYAEFAIYSSINAHFNSVTHINKRWSASKKLFSANFGTKVFFIGVVPVVVRPSVDVTGYLDASAALSISTGFSYDRYYTSGVKYINGGWSNFRYMSGSGLVVQQPQLDVASASIKVSLGVKPKVTVYGIFSISAEALPYITANLNAIRPYCPQGIYFGLYYGVDLKIGLGIERFRIFGRTLISGYQKTWPATILSQRPVNCGICNRCIDLSWLKRQIEEPFPDMAIASGDNVYWTIGEWGECSKSCGVGESTRQVECIVGNEVANPEECRYLPKPQTTRICNTQACNPCSEKSCSDCLALASCNWCSTSNTCLDINTALTTCNNSITTEPELCTAFNPINIVYPESASVWEPMESKLCIEIESEDMNLVLQMRESNSEEDEPTWYGHGLPLFSKVVSPICFYPMGIPTGEYDIFVGDSENDHNLAVVKNVQIDNSFNIPHLNGLRLTPYEGCSVECGGGISVRTATCYNADGEMTELSQCGYVPPLEKRCNEHKCEFNDLELYTGFKEFFSINETFPVEQEVNITWTGGVIGGYTKITLFYYGFDSLASFRGEDRVAENSEFNPDTAALAEPLIVYIGENTGSFVWVVPQMSPSNRYVMEIESTDINGESLGYDVERAYFPVGGKSSFYVGWTEMNTHEGMAEITLVNNKGEEFPLSLTHNGETPVQSDYFFNGEVILKNAGEIVSVLPNGNLESLLVVSHVDQYVRTFSLIDPEVTSPDCYGITSCEMCGRVKQCGWCASSKSCIPVGKKEQPSALIPCLSGWNLEGCPSSTCDVPVSADRIIQAAVNDSSLLTVFGVIMLAILLIQ